MKGKLLNIVLVLILLVGIGLVAYPTFSDMWNKAHTSHAVSRYNDQVKEIDTSEAEAEIEKARSYNETLYEAADKGTFIEQHMEEYNSLLNVGDSGIMGYVEIPAITVTLPIYHGTSDEVLQIAAGHLDWSSLPVGGENTHSIISGHRGLPSARLFTDLDSLQEGDTFAVHVYHEVYYYQVDDISVILPEEVQALLPTAGQDYCTLLTCTPYGINSHRLLVRGRRIFPTFEDVEVSADAQEVSSILISGGLALLVLIIGILGDRRRMKKKKGTAQHRRKERSNEETEHEEL